MPPAVLIGLIGTAVLVIGRFSETSVKIAFVLLALDAVFVAIDAAHAFAPH